jgi:hypothetical protein
MHGLKSRSVGAGAVTVGDLPKSVAKGLGTDFDLLEEDIVSGISGHGFSFTADVY